MNQFHQDLFSSHLANPFQVIQWMIILPSRVILLDVLELSCLVAIGIACLKINMHRVAGK